MGRRTAVSLILATLLSSLVWGTAQAHHMVDFAVPHITRRRCVFLGNMKVSVYHAVPEQTDGDPHITSDGTDVRTLASGDTTCAISQEQLAWNGGVVRFGDTLRVRHGDDAVSETCIARDTMAKEVWKKDLGAWVPLTGYVDIMVAPGVMGFWYEVPVHVCS